MIDPTAELKESKPTHRLVGGAIVIAALAFLTCLPALNGTFVGGDDRRLVLFHVLVNQPSIAHAAQLFTIVHHDLYQPVPLLSFQLEFAAAGVLGWFDKSIEAGAWLFHFDNLWLHAVNALLVGAVLLRFQRHDAVASAGDIAADPLIPKEADPVSAARAVAFIAAVLFAVHPLQVEVTAWINGRMMLLSTLFALLAILSFARWLDRGTASTALLCLVFVLLSATSKIRVGLPVLLAIGSLARGRAMGKRFWALLTPCTLLVLSFAMINLWSTAGADFFAGGAEQLKGPSLGRVLLALDFYLEHLFWPVGLASHYPAPTEVAWGHAAAIRALVVVVSAIVLAVVLSWKSRAVRLGVLWFAAGIIDTLPFVPARNILAADRYMYLPIIGLLWAMATVFYALYCRAQLRGVAWLRPLSAFLGIAVIGSLIGICWHVAETYTTALRKQQRIAELFPDTPRVWERLAWAYKEEGLYEQAIEAARRELDNASPEALSGAYEVIGTSLLEKGERKEGIDTLQKAVAADPESGSAKYYLGAAYDDIDDIGRALPLLEDAAALVPRSDTYLRRLAAVYRRAGQLDRARESYDQAIALNRYDVAATLGLVELDIEIGTDESLDRAEQRLATLMRDVRSEPRLAANLGIVRVLRRESDPSLRLAARVIVALTDRRHEEAAGRVEDLVAQGQAAGPARAWLLQSLERLDQERPGMPWLYGLTTRLLIADHQDQAAQAFLGLFLKTCRSEACRLYGEDLRSALAKSDDGPGP